MKKFNFDPSIFIRPPFIKCPKCGEKSFGILIVCDNHYIRRCNNCQFPSGFESSAKFLLPKLDKKIIYIDQMAISNMMKALNSKMKSHMKVRTETFWIELFNKLYRLCNMQLIICPSSEFHVSESLLYGSSEKPLRRMYNLLSHGLHFHNFEKIKRFQLYEHAKNWINGRVNEKLKLDKKSVIHGNINAWLDNLIVTVEFKYDKNFIDNLRLAREQVTQKIISVFKRWQTEKDKKFWDWFNEEYKAFGRTTLKVQRDYLINQFGKLNDINEKFLSFFNSPPAVTTISYIKYALRKYCSCEHDAIAKTEEYLNSDYLRDVPFIKISAMLYAALARKAASGRVNPPNLGMTGDIKVLSTLLPYCDAMFLDDECRAYLNEKPLRDEIDYGTKIFSQKMKNDFLNYLDKIEKNASDELINSLSEVYGDTWEKQFTDLYNYDS